MLNGSVSRLPCDGKTICKLEFWAILLIHHAIIRFQKFFRREPHHDCGHGLHLHGPPFHHDEDYFFADVLEDAVQLNLFELDVIVAEVTFPVNENLGEGEIVT